MAVEVAAEARRIAWLQQELKDATEHFNALVRELQKTDDRPADEGRTGKHRDDKMNRHIIDLTGDPTEAAEAIARYKECVAKCGLGAPFMPSNVAEAMEEATQRFEAGAAALAERDAAFQAALEKRQVAGVGR